MSIATVATPAAVVAIAAKGKARAVTPAAVEAPTVEALRAAVAAVDASGTYTDAAASTLADAVLARYAFHAARMGRSLDGVTVLADSDRKEVAARVWLDATERTTPPKASERTPGQTSVGQYVSRFGTVATNGAFGIAALSSTDSARDAYKSISEAKSAAKGNEASREFTVWLSGLLPEDAKAITRTLAIFAGEGDASKHKSAFIASL